MSAEFCAGCFRDGLETGADLWCTTCSERVCQSCAVVHRKLSSSHNIVERNIHKSQYSPKQTSLHESAANEYRSTEHCSFHSNQTLNLCCNDHDKIVCSTCVQEEHSNCTSIISIEQAITDFQKGTQIADLKKETLDLMHNMEKIMGELNNALSESLSEKQKIKDKISEIRKQINSHLDYIEVKIVSEVGESCTDYIQNTNETVCNMRKMYEDLTTWRNRIGSVRPHQVDSNIFRTLKFVKLETERQKAVVEDVQMKAITWKMEFRPSEEVINFQNLFHSMGILDVTDTVNTHFRSGSDRCISLMKSFSSSHLGGDVRVFRCCFIPNSRLLFCAFNENCLYSCKNDGSDVITMSLDHQPLGVAMCDNRHAVVTFGSGIQIVNTQTMTVVKVITDNGNFWAVCTLDGKMWVRSQGWTLSNIDKDNGRILRQIKTIFDPRDTFMNKYGDIFCSSNYGDKVYLVTTTGQQREFYSSHDLKLPKGVAVDNNGNVYVAGYITYNIHKISPNGDGEVILSFEDGIKQPRGLSYNRETNELLVILDDGKTVHIYKTHY
ncbi:unnamed protein product [Mytilus coruscus]|uniref:B box-type domain-containing protein n=1 Tax=Mytilus coruscus TaxID=42192 RepID=A0A6J8E3U7_MYTCO|nr:unnamed protein product [Mytilus coruscus]